MQCRPISTLFVTLVVFALLVTGLPVSAQNATATPVPSPAPTTTGAIPLKDAAPTMDPPAVWENFYNLTQVPRPSHHEEEAIAFLSDFGEQIGLETIVNDVGDVIIRKPATPGMEDRPGVILQAHMDMVAQKTADKEQNFETDPIDAYVEDGWVKADRTTLGADDGIGVAIIMAILQDEEIAHPALEALFTTNEEDGFDGINGLEPGVLQGTTFINVDSEEEGVYTISSAGGAFVDISATYTEEETPEDTSAFDVRVGDLQGGHSGVDIDKGRGSASQLLARLIWNAPAELGLRVATLDGGSVSNAIPRNATAIVVVSTDQTDAFEQYVADFAATVKNELAATEPDMVVEATAAELPATVMDADAQQALIGAVYGVPQGVLRMSDDVADLVETSASMGVLAIGDGQFTADLYIRSAIDSARDNATQRISAVFDLTGADVSTNGAYSGWPPNPDSPILALMQQTYEDLFGVAPTVNAVHAGLETSVAGVTYPGMDMISVGPTLHDVHSPDERLEVASVPKVYDLLVATLEAIPAK